LWWQW